MTKTPPNIFKVAVESTPDVKSGYLPGLTALGRDSQKISMADNGLCDGSINIDECTREKYPQLNRWDYSIGYDGVAYFVEIHPADTSAVAIVIKKLEWLKWWLTAEAPELNKIKAKNPYHWIQTGKYSIRPNTPQARLISSVGISLKPISKLSLPR